MSNTDGLLINNNNIYGLVNPPPAPTAEDKAKGYQDISSAAVRWDRFLDLSNNGFAFVPASTQFASIIDEIPWQQGASSTPSDAIWYPAYQQTQVVFSQDKTFSKIKLWLKGRKGLLSTTNTVNLKESLPSNIYIGQSSGTQVAANWADPTVPAGLQGPGALGSVNEDGLLNAILGDPDTGISEGRPFQGEPFEVWDISGPTKLPDPSGNGDSYSLYSNISPNGWNLGWKVVITETAPDGTMKYLEKNGQFIQAQTQDGFILCYNPKAYSFIKGTQWQNQVVLLNPPAPSVLQGFYQVPALTKNNTISTTSPNYATLKDCPWKYSAPSLNPGWNQFGSIIHCQNSQFQGDNLWYVEMEFGEQFNFEPPFTPPGANDYLSAWTPRPVTFKKDHGYLANITMVNLETYFNRQNNGFPGPGIGKVDALTYLELIV